MIVVALGILGALALMAKGSASSSTGPTTEIAPGSESTPTTGQTANATQVDAVTGVDAGGMPTTVMTAEGGPKVVSGSTSAEVSDFGTLPMRADGGAITSVSTQIQADTNTNNALSQQGIRIRRANLPPRAYAAELQRDLRKQGVGF